MYTLFGDIKHNIDIKNIFLLLNITKYQISLPIFLPLFFKNAESPQS